MVQHVAHASGMAALAGTVQCFLNTAGTGSGPVRLGMAGSYFETETLLSLLSGRGLAWHSVADLPAAIEAADDDMLLVEPVRYDWSLSTMDAARIAAAWRRRRIHRTRLVLFDSTLSSVTFPITDVLAGFGEAAPLVVDLRSGLKLDQQGLELANLGVTSVYSREPAAGSVDAAAFARLLRIHRSVSGASVPLDAMAALDLPFVLDRAWTQRHADRVFAHNRRLAAALAPVDGIFRRVVHPALGVGSLRDAPFVVCHLIEDTLENHGMLLAVIQQHARRRGLSLDCGSSFGFRSHRYESIVPQPQDGKGLFKVALGSRAGPSLIGTVALLTELAGYPEFAALRRDHPKAAARTRAQVDGWQATLADRTSAI